VASNEPDNADTNRVDKKENNELWAFIPPAVLPRIVDEYPSSHALLLDGIPVAKDVVAVPVTGGFRFERTLASTRLANEGSASASTWRTVLVQSFGSQLGGYFALDITDPKLTETTGPKFLWQLTTDEDGNPLFGVGGGTPLITTVFLEEGEGQNLTRKEVAVAVLPGGREKTTDGSCVRATKAAGTTDLSPADFPARSQVRCYSAQTGRALTIVRLDNGRILRQFRRSVDESPINDDLIQPVTPLDSPITGEPVAFPGATGAIADKIFVGDADGTMWRVDLSSPKPAEWNMALFLDAYSKEGTGVPAEPISTPPVLSTDFGGNITVAFSTGDQDVFTATGTHHVFSATSDLDSLTAPAQVNWYDKLEEGERVSGPITLFNGVLYYSTFKPAAEAAVCQPDTSRVWAVDYIKPENANDKAAGGFHAFPTTITTDQFIDSSDKLFGADATIFGVSVAQLPSCVETTETTDSFIGSGMHASISQMVPSKFQLVMQVGKSAGNETGQQTNVVSIDLPTPSASPRIDSWAAIVE
jgi:type IV pilus assembly protein PilY1